jgi:hypothetical protein
MQSMTNLDDFPSFKSAAACRNKAASLRAAAHEAISDELAQTYLKIACRWDEIAADYDSTPRA